MNDRLLNGLNDSARAIPDIAKSLDRANTIACARELYVLGEIDKDSYARLLLTILKNSGWRYSETMEGKA